MSSATSPGPCESVSLRREATSGSARSPTPPTTASSTTIADDLLVITADSGVDHRAPHTDHTREYVPLLAVFDGEEGRRHDGAVADVGASALAGSPIAMSPTCPARRSFTGVS